MTLVLAIVAINVNLWIRLLKGTAPRRLSEDPAVPHPDLTITE